MSPFHLTFSFSLSTCFFIVILLDSFYIDLALLYLYKLFFYDSLKCILFLEMQICQLAGMNPDVQFLQVNHEEHKSMCYALNVHVLPFFRFYRGAHGRLCSFSCTNATVSS